MVRWKKTNQDPKESERCWFLAGNARFSLWLSWFATNAFGSWISIIFAGFNSSDWSSQPTIGSGAISYSKSSKAIDLADSWPCQVAILQDCKKCGVQKNMISLANYVHRFLDYLLLQNPAILSMKCSKIFWKGWREWADWLMRHRDLHALSKSQVGQDLYAAYILECRFGRRVKEINGTFVEFGAFDGLTHSNSYLFEKLGWSGVLVEPDPSFARQCSENRTCKVIQACVMGNDFTGSEIMFSAVEGDGELSSIVGYGKPDAALLESSIFKVPVIRLDSLLNSLGTVDVLSIDTEGSELDLLLNSELPVRPRVLIVEHNNDRLKQNKIREAMAEKGYELFSRAGDFFDDFFCDGRVRMSDA